MKCEKQGQVGIMPANPKNDPQESRAAAVYTHTQLHTHIDAFKELKPFLTFLLLYNKPNLNTSHTYSDNPYCFVDML